MPRTLKVYSGSEVEGQQSELHYIMRHMRQAVCWVASNQYNIHAFAQSTVLDELAESVASFVFGFARQVSIIFGLAGRRQTNFMDVMNALFLYDRKLYREFLDSNNMEFCPSQNMHDAALWTYLSLRYGKPAARPVQSEDAEFLGSEGLPMAEKPSLIELPPTFMLATLQRLIQNSRYHQEQVGLDLPPLPTVSLDNIVNNPIASIPVKPGSLTNLSDILKVRENRAAFAPIENQHAMKFKTFLYKKEEGGSVNKSRMAGVLKRPVAIASDQLPIIASLPIGDFLSTGTTDNAVPLKGLPFAWPSDLPDWAPLLFADGSTKQSGHSTSDKIQEMEIDSQENIVEKTALQLELCDIEPDYPQIKKFSP